MLKILRLFDQIWALSWGVNFPYHYITLLAGQSLVNAAIGVGRSDLHLASPHVLLIMELAKIELSSAIVVLVQSRQSYVMKEK